METHSFCVHRVYLICHTYTVTLPPSISPSSSLHSWYTQSQIMIALGSGFPMTILQGGLTSFNGYAFSLTLFYTSLLGLLNLPPLPLPKPLLSFSSRYSHLYCHLNCESSWGHVQIHLLNPLTPGPAACQSIPPLPPSTPTSIQSHPPTQLTLHYSPRGGGGGCLYIVCAYVLYSIDYFTDNNANSILICFYCTCS